MTVLLCAVSPVAEIRHAIATAARDHGLAELLPGVFEGQVTAYRFSLLGGALRRLLRGRRPYRVELFTIPDGHACTRFRRLRA